jgi:signal transduction histidine kinase/CheY-like chemotaxis protein
MHKVGQDFLRPMSELLRTASEVTRTGRLDLRAGISRSDELGQLAAAFNRMLEMIGERDATLRSANAQIEAVLAAATEIAIISTDRDGTVRIFNTGAERMLGYTSAEVVGLHTPLLWHSDEEIRERAKELSGLLGRNVGGFGVLAEPVVGKGAESREWTLIRKDGSRLRAQLAITAVRGADGEGVGYLGIATDITERQRSAEELRLREVRFRSLIENASDLITVMAGDGTITFQSPSSGQILDWDPSEVIGANAYSFVHPDDLEKAVHAFEKVLARPAPMDLATPTRGSAPQRPAPRPASRPVDPEVVVLRLRHRDGSWRLIELVGRAASWESGKAVVVLNGRDITQTSQLEEQLRQSQKMEAIGQLSGGIAHDFNNILTVIQGHVSLIDSHPVLPADVRESAVEIDQAAKRAANLTRQLLAFSRKQTLQPTDTDLNDVVANMTRMLHRILGEDIRMSFNYSAPPAWVRADVGMLEQVLLNLVVNARDAMPQGGLLDVSTAWEEVAPETAAANSEFRAGSFVVLSVSDSGSGIPAEILPRIFEPFFTTKGVGKGTGLGLATVYGIVKQHQGWVVVRTEIGKGTQFRVYLPRIANPAAKTPLKEPLAEAGKGRNSNGATILVVEDEPALRSLVRTVLTGNGFRILEAPNGVLALDLWRRHQAEVQLLLTDLVMPDGMTGRQLAESVCVDCPELPVIFTSGYSADVAGVDLDLREGVNFLPKPYGPAALVDIVLRTLSSRRRPVKG